MAKPAFIKPATETVPVAGSYLARIVKLLSSLGTGETVNPDKTSNIGNLIGEAYLWDEVQAFAKKRSEALWKKIEAEHIRDRTTYDPGVHVIAESRHFVVKAEVTQPVNRFNPGVLAKLMHKAYKVPLPRTIELVEQAKVPDKSQFRLNIIEKVGG